MIQDKSHEVREEGEENGGGRREERQGANSPVLIHNFNEKTEEI